MHKTIDFNVCPFLLIWEVTRGCALACRHCRAEAINWRHPNELSLAEGKALLDDVRAMGTPIVVLTGGDPLQRDDLEELIAHGKSIGLRMGTIPATTPRLTAERVQCLKGAGLDQMAISIDGSDAARHDGFRRVAGSFETAMAAARYAADVELPLQVNTVFADWNVDDFERLAELVVDLGVVFWEVFFLVPTGRGIGLASCTAAQMEQLFEKLYTLSQSVDCMIKVTEAPHYRAYIAQHHDRSGPTSTERGDMTSRKPVGLQVSQAGVNSGKGFCFVDHVGDVYPSGFLPIVAGNVRRQSVVELYRDSPIFRELRDVARLKGACGKCRFRELCGGSRSRAYAMTGDYLAPEPFCTYGQAGVVA